jgi:hypothetical protein
VGVPELRRDAGGITADDEGAGDPGGAAAGYELGQVRPVPDLLSGQVRGDLVAVGGQLLGKPDGCVLPLGTSFV